MRYLPIYLDATALPCLVVGGGEIAARKIHLLKQVGARVRVVALTRRPELLAREDVEFICAAFSPSHLVDQRLVIAATDDPHLNAAVAQACRASGILVNVVDAPALCGFIVPAIIDRSPLILSVSTGGAAPVLATHWRERLEALLPGTLATLAEFMGGQRAAVKAAHRTGPARRRFWQQFLSSEVPQLLTQAPDAAAAAFAELLTQDLDARLAPRLSVVELASPEPADLTLGALALLSDADRLIYAANVPAAIRRYARRDAEVIELPSGSRDASAVPPATGHTVYVTLRDTGVSTAYSSSQSEPSP